MSYTSTFKRYEKKYLITKEQRDTLSEYINALMKPDEYGETTIFNTYYDTRDYRLIRASIEKPVYKEKLRLRCYGIPGGASSAFVELKKKYRGVVYKRRAVLDYKTAVDYLSGRKKPECESQIMHEIDWFMDYYGGVFPSMMITHDRCAFFGVNDPELRLTFDKNILWRTDCMKPGCGVYGNELLSGGEYLMEIKFAGAFPI